MNHKQPIGNHFLLAGLYLCLAVISTWPLAQNLAGQVPMPEYIHDRPWVHMLWSNLWWAWQVQFSWLELLSLPTHIQMIFPPVGISTLVYFFQTLIPTAVFAVLFALTWEVILSGNLLLLLSLAACGYTVFLLAAYVLKNNWAAFISGAAFLLCSPVMANAQGHLLAVASLPILPVFILFFIKTVHEQTWKNILILALVSCLLFFVYWYFAVFCLLFGLIYLLMQGRSLQALGRVSLAALICVTVLSPLILAVLGTEQLLLDAPLDDLIKWSVDVSALIIPSQDHTFFGPLVQDFRARLGGNPTIQDAGYLGWSLLALGLLALVSQARKKSLPWLLTFFFFILLALGPYLHFKGSPEFSFAGLEFQIPLPLLLLHQIPVLGAVRDCSMFMFMAFISLALVAGFGARALLCRVRKTWTGFCLTLILGGLIFLDFTILPFPVFQYQVPEIMQDIRSADHEHALVDVPLDYSNRQYALHQSVHHKPLLFTSFTRSLPFYDQFGRDLILWQILLNPGKMLNQDCSREIRKPEAALFQLFFRLDTVVMHTGFLSKKEAKEMDRFIRSRFQVKNTVHGEQGLVVYELYIPDFPEKITAINIDFSNRERHAHLKRGWHRSQNLEGRRIAWSSNQMSTIYLYLPEKSGYEVSLEVKAFDFPGLPPQSLEISVNGTPFHETVLQSGEWNRIRAAMPPKAVTAGINRLEFRSAYTAVPAQMLKNSDDDRDLGMAYDHVRIQMVNGP